LLGNIIVLSVLTVAFQSQWLKIEWVGTIVIALYVWCVLYIVTKFRREVMAINSMPNA
jgi:glycine betaine transporter